MTGLFSLTYGNIAVSALIICGIAALTTLAGRVVWYRIRVALDDHYYPPQRPELPDGYDDSRESMEKLADSLRDSPDRQHSWPNIAPLLIESGPATADPAAYPLSLAPDLDEDQAPTDPSGRHAEAEGRVSVDEVTGYVRLAAVIPDPVDDERALAVVASVSGVDGAS